MGLKALAYQRCRNKSIMDFSPHSQAALQKGLASRACCRASFQHRQSRWPRSSRCRAALPAAAHLRLSAITW